MKSKGMNHIHDRVCECYDICSPPNESCSELGLGGCGCECFGISLGRTAALREIAHSWENLMTRDEIIAMFTEMIDRCWEAGFDEGYHRGQEDQDA